MSENNEVKGQTSQSNNIETADLESGQSNILPGENLELAPTTDPYNLAKHQESFRGLIAISLIALLSIIVVFSLWFIAKIPKGDGLKAFENLTQILQIIFGPLVTLVATAVGYYFGANSAKSND